MMHLVQLKHPQQGRRVAAVEQNHLRLLEKYRSLYELSNAAIASGNRLEETATASFSTAVVDYDSIYQGASDWHLLPAFDHPNDPARCMVAGTGLTHTVSARNRQAMHAGDTKETVVTDSMRMFQWGVEGGRPLPGEIGVAPEWFYKGRGTVLRAHGEPLEIPAFADDGGDEAEVAGVYVIDPAGQPRRVGFTTANEFSDHKFERKNYLYLAESKLRTCAIGPELIVDGKFDDVRGEVRIRRNDKILWSHQVVTGEKNMSHTLANLEHHHFKHAEHRHPGDAHVFFFGADAFSFGEGIALSDEDVMEIELPGFGRPLRNPVKIHRVVQKLVSVGQL
jgi:hypothetical protein